MAPKLQRPLSQSSPTIRRPQTQPPRQVVLCEPTQQARNDACAAEAERSGMTIVPPYNHPDVIAGQGTLGLEMAEQIANLDAVIVPTSGGGMLAGVAMALAPQGIKIYAVEPAGKRLEEALAAGERVIDPVCGVGPTRSC